MHKLPIIALLIVLSFFSCQKAEESSQLAAQEIVEIPIGIRKILKAYPEQLIAASHNSITWNDGTIMSYDDGKRDKTFLQLLNEADLEDQVMSMAYPKGELVANPQQGQDPGRVRHEAFFKKMYGATQSEVLKNLRTIVWLPKTLKLKLPVTRVNGIDTKLEEVSKLLDDLPHLHKYVSKPGGTFVWRPIAGTTRLSMHSFGMTIDINVDFSNYWRWDSKAEEDDGHAIIEYKNRIPMELVKIFEDFGFIWGGKWYHYDTMHFEYRPELLVE